MIGLHNSCLLLVFYSVNQPKPQYVSHIHTVIIVIYIGSVWSVENDQHQKMINMVNSENDQHI